MKLPLLSLTVAAAFIATEASNVGQVDRSLERGLQDLAQRWNIQDPTFNYNSTDLQFSLNWKVSDFIQDKHMYYRVYDGFECKDGGADDITESSNDINGTYYLYTSGLVVSTLTPWDSNPATSGSGERDAHLHLSIEGANIADSPIYGDSTNGAQVAAQVRFCVRYSLWNDHPNNEDSVEVNFQETVITFDVDLTDGFEVAAIDVKPKDENIETANVGCEVIGYECNLDNTPITNPGYLRNQGSETRVCVTTTEESKRNGLYLNRVNWFYFYRQNDEGRVTQNAIIMDSVSAPNGLTDYDCQPGEDPCGWDTILYAQFFDRPGIGIVQGIGQATCQYGQLNGDDNNDVDLSGQTTTPAASVTAAPVNPAEVTPAPAVVTNAPVTPAPVTPAPATPAPVTPAPVTPAPVTPAPVTPAPATPAPVVVTNAPVTPAPVTPAPVTPAPVTPAPVTPAPVTPAPATPAPVTPAPVTPAPVAPPPGTTPAPFDHTPAYPTPAPCSGPNCYQSCGTEAYVVQSSDEDRTWPDGAITIDEQAPDGTSVTFTITQLWKIDESVSWVAIMFPDITEGSNTCPKTNTFQYQQQITKTAACFDGTATPVRVFIEVYLHDGQFKKSPIITVPAACNPSKDPGKKIGYEIYIPCQPCSVVRKMTEEEPLAVVSSSGAGSNSNEPDVPDNAKAVVPNANKSDHSPRIAQSLVQRRRLQEIPPVTFEMDFSIVSNSPNDSSGPALSKAFLLAMTVISVFGVMTA